VVPTIGYVRHFLSSALFSSSPLDSRTALKLKRRVHFPLAEQLGVGSTKEKEDLFDSFLIAISILVFNDLNHFN